MEKYNLYCIVKDTIISIPYISCSDVLKEFVIPLLHPCLSLIHAGYILCQILMDLYC